MCTWIGQSPQGLARASPAPGLSLLPLFYVPRAQAACAEPYLSAWAHSGALRRCSHSPCPIPRTLVQPLTIPRANPQHLPKALLTAQAGAEQKAALVQGQLAQEISGQESWPQPGDILNAWHGRKEHQDAALASKGSTAQQAGGAAIATDTRGEEAAAAAAAAKQVEQLLPPCPAAGSGCAGTLPGHCGAEPCSPQPGLSSPSRGCSRLRESTIMGLQLLLTHNPHRQCSQSDAPHWGTHSPAGTEGRACSYIQLPTGTPGCRRTGSISTQV